MLDLLGQTRISGILGEHRVLITDGGDTGPRGGNDVVVVSEGSHVLADGGNTLVEVSGVGRHLGATGLFPWELNFAAEALQQGGDGHARLREHHVIDARNEQPDGHTRPRQAGRGSPGARACSGCHGDLH